MDVQALLVFLGGFGFCAVVGYIVSVLGAKEQTYEDALREQKERNKETRKPNKAKTTDVKKKKWNKKNKDGGGPEKNDTVPVVLVASSSKAKKRRKGNFAEVEVIVDTTGDNIEEERDDEQDRLYQHQDNLEDDVVLVESVKEQEEHLVIEDSPEPSPLPTPEPKKPKAKKKKIVIEEVDEVVEEAVTVVPAATEEVAEEVVKKEVIAAEAPTPASAPIPASASAPEPVAKVTPTKTKAKKQKQESSSSQTSANPSNPRDLLATIKRTPFNDEEAQAMINVLLTKQSGGPTNNEEWIEQGKPSESQRLKQELGEVTKALEEERNNKLAFEKQLTAMRKDLNEKLAGVKKAAGAEHQRILNDLANQHTHQMNQANSRLAELHNNEMGMRQRLEELQMEKLHTVSTYQAQVDNLSHQLQMAQTVPTPTFNDPSLLSELEQLRSLRDRYEGQLNEFLVENKTLKERVNALETHQGEETTQLSSAQSEATQLGLAKASLEAQLARLTSQLQQKEKAAPEAQHHQAELAAVKSRLTEAEAETVKLQTENSRLSTQLAETQRGGAKGLAEALKASKDSPKANGHPEIDSNDSQGVEHWRQMYQTLSKDHEKMLAKQKVFQAEFEEKLAANQKEIQVVTSKNNELSSGLKRAEGTSQQLLNRLFPSMSNCNEEKALAHIASLEASSAGDQADELERLEGQVEHYKTVLAQTETMLTSLQASVESAEHEWRLKLEAANKELESVRGDAASLAAKVAKLETELTEVGNSHEMQAQVAALQAQVLAHQTEKEELVERNKELLLQSEGMAEQVKSLTNRQEELAKGNTGLQAALAVAQEAVEKERGGIKALQETLQGKDSILGNGTGPSDEMVQ